MYQQKTKPQVKCIEASSGLTDAEINRMRDEAKANADADKKAKDRIDKINQADSLIFQTEKQLKEFGDKIPADKKQPIEKALEELKEAHKAEDLTRIETAMANLNNVFQAASQEMYNSQEQQGAQGQPNANAGQQNGGNAKGPDNQEVTDVDFEEVK